MELEAIKRPLSISEIEFRVQSINNGGYATILAYKDARVDMNRLDEAFGVFGWKREHSRDNQNCTVSIWDGTNKQWVSKEDTGTESTTEKEKGLASDSFKRACFNIGIGRELYDYPVISVKLNPDEFEVKEYQGKKRAKATWNLKIKQWSWFSQWLENKDKEPYLQYLAAKDDNGKVRFTFGTYIKPE